MPLNLSRNDIRMIECDAIVDPTDHIFSHSGSIDKEIHRLAGEELARKCAEFPMLETGEAVITPSYQFTNCHYIIHTCGPIYEDGTHNEAELLANCYRNCLKLALENGCASIAFPLIASGTFSFPKGQALKIATDTITDFLLNEEMEVYLLVYDKEAFDTSKKLFKDVEDYLAPVHIEEDRVRYSRDVTLDDISSFSLEKAVEAGRPSKKAEKQQRQKSLSTSLNSILSKELDLDLEDDFEPDESFGDYLIRLIDERKLKDPEVYKRANVSKDNFHKIISGKIKTPKKKTAVALAIALRLDLDGTNKLLGKAGLVLSPSYKFDKIIMYCLKNGQYDIFEINELLFANDQEVMC